MKVLINGKDAFFCSREEIHEAWGIMQRASRAVEQRVASSFEVGQLVAFDSKKRGMTITGRIVRINQTSITIKPENSPYSSWKVSPSLLRPVIETQSKMKRLK